MSKRTSEGERKALMLNAAQQAEIDIIRAKLERLSEDADRLRSDLTRILAQPPFAKATT